MIDCKPAPTPYDPGQKLSIKLFTNENSLVGKVPYQEAIGSLLYIANATRPDLAFAVNDLSRFNKSHSEPHWKAVKRVFRYLKGTWDMKLTYQLNDLGKKIIAYCDSDWGSEEDERRSCSGYVVMMCGGAVSWQSKKQTLTAQSSTEAEYIALSCAVKETIWLNSLAEEIAPELKQTVTLMCDNQGAIQLAKSEGYRSRSKHIALKYHHIRENVANKDIDLQHIGTEEMIADSLTKAVFGSKTLYCTTHMGLLRDKTCTNDN